MIPRPRVAEAIIGSAHHRTSIHGEIILHRDYYYLAVVPPTARLRLCKSDLPTESKQQYYCPEPRLTSSYDLIKRCVSLVQAIWAIFTAYRARGDQLEQYGYAAFGLTVVPYAVMSIINLTAQILNPDYPCMFVIETPTLARARLEGRAVVQGTIPVKYGDDLVGEEENNNDEKSQAAPSRLWTWARKKLSRIFAASDAHFFPDASQISRRDEKISLKTESFARIGLLASWLD